MRLRPTRRTDGRSGHRARRGRVTSDRHRFALAVRLEAADVAVSALCDFSVFVEGCPMTPQ